MQGNERHDDSRHRDEVSDTYRAAARLQVYSVWAAGIGVLLAVSVLGAMLIGWMDASDGVTWLGFALLSALVLWRAVTRYGPLARIYDDEPRASKTVSIAAKARSYARRDSASRPSSESPRPSSISIF